MEKRTQLRAKVAPAILIFLFITAVYLYAFPQANLIYPVVDLAHAGFGLLALFGIAWQIYRSMKTRKWAFATAWLVLFFGAIVGALLIYTGTSRPEWRLLYIHIVASVAGGVMLLPLWLQARKNSTTATLALQTIVLGIAALGLAGACQYLRVNRWDARNRIHNPKEPPVSMNFEGDGSKGAFFPSSAQTMHKGYIPPDYFTQSDACERCHQDIYDEWKHSMHHFSSFNNQWYRRSIEYMQDTIGVKPSKWCAGCHDPALAYSGMFDTPVKHLDLHSPPAQAGLGCMMCHSISRVKSTMGQADFYLEYPELHQLAASKNPLIRYLHDFAIKLNPEPHRRVFLKPFMKDQTAEFCSSCHKVHLDAPVNSYRWLRGFNEYDNWQASGVSGMGARSFYYPPKPQQCADCHMPLTPSHDFGNVNGFIHSHNFAAANTAVPFSYGDTRQVQAAENFLKGAVTVDIFAISPDRPEAMSGGSYESDLSTSFGVGEESSAGPAEVDVATAPVTAPLNRVNAVVRRGDDVRVDVVVRTRKVGHFFPGGTIDAFDTWVELKAVDDKGKVVFWSGKVEDDGKGPVDPSAHFYKSLQIDAHGNPINKRNAWATRAVVYVRLIPPGAADTVHYRLHIPNDAGSKITLTSRLLYRKFSWYNTQFSFAGQFAPEQKLASYDPSYDPSYDDRIMQFNRVIGDVSATVKGIPDLPIVTMSESQATLNVAAKGTPPPKPEVKLEDDDWTRWNDYGIGLFLQGDLKGARAAFEKITEIDPKNADGWVNLGRVAVQEGDMARARNVLEKALALQPKLARANYFYARVLRNDGQYDEAANRLRLVLDQYPKDRVVRNDLGRTLFLQHKYTDAVIEYKKTLAIDPEDLQAHYNLMLCYQGLGDDKNSQLHRTLYMRFKADEASQAITGEYRLKHPYDNIERQPVHEHVSAPLAPERTKPMPRTEQASRPHGSKMARAITGGE
ncbi:MAG TPA: tetratricopeptide repeat protein [Terriglobales bacterium]|nr:tetratricopeptide repeat protein [Terriglobales bacterium]